MCLMFDPCVMGAFLGLVKLRLVESGSSLFVSCGCLSNSASRRSKWPFIAQRLISRLQGPHASAGAASLAQDRHDVQCPFEIFRLPWPALAILIEMIHEHLARGLAALPLQELRNHIRKVVELQVSRLPRRANGRA